MDCKHEEYDMEGRHCKLSHCAKGVGMRCKRDYGEWCNCYESINGKNKHRNDPLKPPKTGFNAKKEPKNIYHYIVEKDTYAIRKDASNDGEFVELLNAELKELIKNLSINMLKEEIIKLAHEAHSKRDECATNYDKKLLDVDYSNWNRYMGQFEAYSKVVELIDNILEVYNK